MLPAERIRWASLSSGTGTVDPSLPECRAFPAPKMHWRLRGSVLENVVVDELWALIRARHIARWVRDFDPQLLWVFPELAGVAVARHLSRILQTPLHLTVHDAPECVAQSGMSRAYVGRFLRSTRELCRRSASIDAVSRQLIEHVPTSSTKNLVYAPSMPKTLMPTTAMSPDMGPDGRLRKIGLCGTLRASGEQWQSFVKCLGAQPFRFELVIVSAPERYPQVSLPKNVSVSFRPYFETEIELVEFFSHSGLFACYLGLWREPDRELFARTSLSSKLSAYASAGVPVLVDGPECSAAWELLKQYKAGFLFRPGCDVELTAWLGDVDGWRTRAGGGLTLARERFDIERNVEALVRLWKEL